MIKLLRNISLALLLLFSRQFLLAQDPTEIALAIHDQIHCGQFAEAKSNMLKLKRKLLTFFTNPNISIFSEYLRLCEENGWDGSEKEEARYFSNMLRSAYLEKTDKLIAQTVPIVKSMCNYNNGVIADIFFDIVKDFLPLEQKLELQYEIAWAYNDFGLPYMAWYKFRDCANQYNSLDKDKYEIQYARCLNGIAYVNRFLGNDVETINLYTEIEPIFVRHFGDQSFEYAVNCDNIGRTYLENFKDYEKAIFYMKKAYEIFKLIPDTEEHVSICLNNIACCYGKMGDLEMELQLLLEANELGTSNNVISNIANVYNRIGNHQKALEFYRMLPDSYLQSIAATDYAENCAARNDISEFIKYEGIYLDFLRDVRMANFEEMIGSDREVYSTQPWNCGLDSLFRIGNRTKNTEITKLCYDCLLFHKSISLSCDRSIESIVESSSNTELRNAYNSLVGIKRKHGGEKEYYENTERDFLRLLSKEGNYTSFMDIRWQDIKNRLEKDNVAIEFHVADQHDEFNIYAVILTNNFIKLLCLGSSTEVSNIYNLWDEIEPYIINADNVYFSPDGILNTYPLEAYVNKKEGQKFYRLSSTRELVSEYSTQGKDTYIYGGLIYDTPIDSLNENTDTNKNANRALTYGDLKDLRGSINKLSYLPGTEQEAKNIANLISSQKPNELGTPILYLGNKGTELSFKNLHGIRPKVIHISTHGFYYRDDENSSEKNHIDVNNALKRTGLLLSGAETPNSLEYSTEDGILTAQEISMLDLRGLDLVSLSACETGLGEISSDGILGLQWGFKKAGAKSILMSLWEVDDDATSMFMTEFYNNLTNGFNKYDSLERAKELIKEQKAKGWDDPEYWSAFILLDGF